MKKEKSPDNLVLPPELRKAIKEMQQVTSVMTDYPWSGMEIGDSVLFQAEVGETLDSMQSKVETLLSQYTKITGKTFFSKRILKDNGVRVWRKQ